METTFKTGDQEEESKMLKTKETTNTVTISKMSPGVGSDVKKRFCHINKNTLPFKLHFFLFMGAMGALLPFRQTIGITRLGLGAGNLAVMYTTQQFLFIVFKPVIGYVTDYFNNLKAMIFILTVMNGVLSYLLLVIPSVGDVNVPHLNESFSTFPSYDNKFCHLCQDSNKLRETIELLPNINGILQNLSSCRKEKHIHEVFNCHCGINQSSLVSLNVTYEIIFETCPIIHSTTVEESLANFGNLSSNSSVHGIDRTIYMTVFYNQLLQFEIVCPRIRNASVTESTYFTPSFIIKSCYLDPEKHLFTNSRVIVKESLYHNPLLAKSNDPGTLREDSYKSYKFWVFTVIIILTCACTSAIFTLSDTACYESLQETGEEYGKQRAWGAVSWGLIAPFAGFLNDYTDSYLAAMILMTLLCALVIWNMYKMDLSKPQNSQNILKDIKKVLSSAEFIAFSVGVFFNGMGIGVVWFYLAWFITDIGGSSLLIGLAHTVQCFLGEMPIMFFSGWLLKNIGHFNVVSLALLCHGVRFLAYSSLQNPWHILFVECLDGITFGAFYTAMTSYGKLSSKPGTEATTQSLLCSTYEGLGAGLGCVIAGVCFDHYGSYKTFYYGGLFFGATAAINVISTVLLRYKKARCRENSCDKNRR